jgi:formylglycine-generating enzyme required for sulfatase activity
VYPAEPYEDSFLGLLRTKTGLDFDLPSEAQWEFAARAGNGEGYWGNGSAMRIAANKDAGLAKLGRYQYNGGFIGGTTHPGATCEATNATAIVGSYAPNAWGLYDVHGNVWEWCLDSFVNNITGLNGAVNTGTSGKFSQRGGAWNAIAGKCRPAYRVSATSTGRAISDGFRVLCTAGLR